MRELLRRIIKLKPVPIGMSPDGRTCCSIKRPMRLDLVRQPISNDKVQSLTVEHTVTTKMHYNFPLERAAEMAVMTDDGCTVIVARGITMQMYTNGDLTFEQKKAHKQAMTDMRLSEDGTLLATASDDRRARVWRLTDEGGLSRVKTLDGHVGAVKCCRCLPPSPSLPLSPERTYPFTDDSHEKCNANPPPPLSFPPRIPYRTNECAAASCCTRKTTSAPHPTAPLTSARGGQVRLLLARRALPGDRLAGPVHQAVGHDELEGAGDHEGTPQRGHRRRIRRARAEAPLGLRRRDDPRVGAPAPRLEQVAARRDRPYPPHQVHGRPRTPQRAGERGRSGQV